MLKGKLSDFDIISMFEMLNQQSKTGVLTIKTIDFGEVNIYFLEGNIIELSYKDLTKNLGYFLVKKQIIKKSVLKKIQSRAKKEIKSITTILNEDGFISEDLEELIITVYYDDAFREILNVKNGEFSFNPDNKKNNKEVLRIFYIEHVLLEFVRQRDEIRTIKNLMPLENAKISKTNNANVELNDDEESLYELINDIDDLERLRGKILINYFDYINILLSLAQKKVITVTKYINEEDKQELSNSYIDDFKSNALGDKFNILMLSLSISTFIIVVLIFILRGIILLKKDVSFIKNVEVETKKNELFKKNYSSITNVNK